jgi:hypothetical protein
VDSIAELVAEHVINESVLGDPRHALECGRGHDRIEMVTVARYIGDGAGNPGLDP